MKNHKGISWYFTRNFTKLKSHSHVTLFNCATEQQWSFCPIVQTNVRLSVPNNVKLEINSDNNQMNGLLSNHNAFCVYNSESYFCFFIFHCNVCISVVFCGCGQTLIQQCSLTVCAVCLILSLFRNVCFFSCQRGLHGVSRTCGTSLTKCRLFLYNQFQLNRFYSLSTINSALVGN